MGLSNLLNINTDSLDAVQFIKNLVVFVMVGLVSVIGGFDSILQTLLMFMFIDIVVGSIVAFAKGKFRSRSLLLGVARKAGMIVLIMVIHSFDLMLGSLLSYNIALRDVLIWIFVFYEGSSITELMIEAGVPVPSILKDMFDKAKEVSDAKLSDLVKGLLDNLTNNSD